MPRKAIIGLLSLSLFGLPLLGGCDKKVAETESKKTDANGNTQTDKKTVSTTQGGGTKTEETHKTTTPP